MKKTCLMSIIIITIIILYGRVCDTPPTIISTVKHIMASWSFWVQKHFCGIKIHTLDALSGHHCQISKTFYFWKKTWPPLSGHLSLTATFG